MTEQYTVLEAKDGSKNFIWGRGEGQALEARYVVRNKTELICYLSSQTACERVCRMCHLTRTGQVHPTNATMDDFTMQAERVLREAYEGNSFRFVNYNFMARGEPMDNLQVQDRLLETLGMLAKRFGLIARFKISTIMPEGAELDLIERFGYVQPDIYYSLYSVNPQFRKKWFPKAAKPAVGLKKLREWQQFSHKIPKIHLALIKGENDGVIDLEALCNAIDRADLRVDFNIVRYNPFDASSEEGDWEYAREIFETRMPDSTVQVVQRVGYEAKASCGMFVS